MKLADRQRREQSSAAMLQTFWLMTGCFALLMAGVYAAQPGWWSTVLNGNPANDYMAANQGQLKEFTMQAANDLTNLPGTTGAGSDLSNIVYAWKQDYLANNYASTSNPTHPYKPGDYQAVNVGQLKYIGNKVWIQLVNAGYTNALPSWLTSTNASDLNVANIGQMKTVFNFDVTYDSDGNGLPDWWEIKYFGGVGAITGYNTNSSPTGNGQTLLQDYQEGNDPNNYYNQGGTNRAPTILIINGAFQTNTANQYAPNPLTVQLVDSLGNHLENAPVLYTVTSGTGLLSPATNSPMAFPVLTAITQTGGYAPVHFKQPNVASFTSTITVTADGVSTNFYETTSSDTGAPTAPTDLAATAGSSAGEIDLTWQNNADNATGILIEQSTNGTYWTPTVTLTDPTATSYAVTGLTEGTDYYFGVASTNSVSASSYNTLSSSLPPETTPQATAPTVSAVADQSGNMTLSWVNNLSSATNFYIESSTNGGISGSWNNVDTVSNTNSYYIAASSYPTLALYRVTAQALTNSAPAVPSNPPSYAIIDLGPGTGKFINNNGQVACQSSIVVSPSGDYNWTNYFWSQGVRSPIPLVGLAAYMVSNDSLSDNYQIYGLNDNGVLALQSINSVELNNYAYFPPDYFSSITGLSLGTFGIYMYADTPYTWSPSSGTQEIQWGNWAFAPCNDLISHLSTPGTLYANLYTDSPLINDRGVDGGVGAWWDSPQNYPYRLAYSWQPGGTPSVTNSEESYTYINSVGSPVTVNSGTLSTVVATSKAGTNEVMSVNTAGSTGSTNWCNGMIFPTNCTYAPYGINDWPSPIIASSTNLPGNSYTSYAGVCTSSGGSWVFHPLYDYSISGAMVVGNVWRVNNQGQMLVNDAGVTKFWHNGQLYDPNKLVPAAQGPNAVWANIGINDINNGGAMAGTASKLVTDAQGNPVINPLTGSFTTNQEAVALLPVDIEPDNPGQSGVTGDLVPSIKKASGQKHYVSPKQASSFVVLKAIVPSFADSNFSKYFEWDTINPDGTASSAGQAVPGSPDKWEVKRDTPGQYIVRLKTLDNQIAAKINVWIVWSNITGSYLLGTTLESPTYNVSSSPSFTTITSTGISYMAQITPSSIFNKMTDIPNLTGPLESTFHADASTKQHVLYGVLLGDPNVKWSLSRQWREHDLVPNLTGAQCNFPSFSPLYTTLPNNSIIQATSPVANGTNGYPSDLFESNDRDATVSTGDPYATGGILLDTDYPSSGVQNVAGNIGDTAEFRAQWQDYVRVDINKHWYVVSDYMFARFHFKFKKIASSTWVDNSSIVDTSNTGF